jgi:hypothetical protein
VARFYALPSWRAPEESSMGNSHTQDVRDPALVDSEFFDPRDLIQVKYEMLGPIGHRNHLSVTYALSVTSDATWSSAIAASSREEYEQR